MKIKELSPIRYYEYDDVIFLAKRGEYNATRDVYQYNEKGKKWSRFNINDKEWKNFAPLIFQSREMSLERLKKSSIPLIKDDSPDITTQILEEAEKLKGKIKNKPQ